MLRVMNSSGSSQSMSEDHELLEDGDGAVVGGVDGVDGVERDWS